MNIIRIPGVFGLLFFLTGCGLPSIGYLEPPEVLPGADNAYAPPPTTDTELAFGFFYDEDDIFDDPTRNFQGFAIIYRVFPITSGDPSPWTAVLDLDILETPTGLQELVTNHNFRRFAVVDPDDIPIDGVEDIEPKRQPTIEPAQDNLGLFVLSMDEQKEVNAPQFDDHLVVYRNYPVFNEDAPDKVAVLARDIPITEDSIQSNRYMFRTGVNVNIQPTDADVQQEDSAGDPIDQNDITGYGIVMFVAAAGFDNETLQRYFSYPVHLTTLDGDPAVILETQ